MPEAETAPAHDKHGQEIQAGDVVTFVYGGDTHEMTVEEIVPSEIHLFRSVLKGKVAVRIFPEACTKLTKPAPGATEPTSPADKPTRTKGSK